jgi:ABC-type sugar transport system substrate-binding protein
MKPQRVLISLMTSKNDYQQEQAAAAEQAARRLGVEVKVIYAENDSMIQSQQLRQVLNGPADMRPDAIICHAVDSPFEQIARSAVESGIGWAILNREVTYLTDLHQQSKVPVVCVMVNQEEVGRIQARQFATLLPKGGVVLYVQGAAGNYSAERRTAGMRAAKPANLQVMSLRGRFTEESGYKAAKDWLDLPTTRDAKLNLVGAQNDNMALGAQKAFKENSSSRWSHLQFTGCDAAGAVGRSRIQKGILIASIAIPPTAGIALELLVASLKAGTKPTALTMLAPASFPVLESIKPLPAA